MIHLLDWTCETVNQLVHTTFTIVTLGLIMTVDYAIIVATVLHGMVHGPVSLLQAMNFTEEAGLAFGIDINTDARNLQLALESIQTK